MKIVITLLLIFSSQLFTFSSSQSTRKRISHAVYLNDPIPASPPKNWYVIPPKKSPSREAERFASTTKWLSHAQDPSVNKTKPAEEETQRAVKSPQRGCAVPHRFGTRCDGICHCSTVAACDKSSGRCSTGICAHGYMDPPYCQRACPPGQFGFRCGFYCHCWKGGTCNSVNGFCAPDGRCANEWFGPSCQVRKLELSDSPVVLVNRCDNITVSWRQWASDLDFGNPDLLVTNYELELRTPARPQWRTIYRILNDDESVNTNNREPVVFNFTPSPNTRFYQFRVLVNGQDQNGKYVTGVPGIPTEVFQRNCPSFGGHTLPPVVTETRYSHHPTHSIQTVTSSSRSTSSSRRATPSTSSTPSTTTTRPVLVSQFETVNDPRTPGNVVVYWELSPVSAGIPNDAALLVEMLGIGDCDPFQTTDGPQIFKLSSLSGQILHLNEWRHYRITLLESIGASTASTANLAQQQILTTGHVPNVAVDNMQLEDVASRSARLSWASLSCEDRGDTSVVYETKLYRQPRTSNNSNSELVLTESTNRTWMTFMNLSSSYEYKVEIAGVNSLGTGPISHFQFTTPSEEQPRPPPQLLPYKIVSPSSIIIAWLIAPATPGLKYPSMSYCELKITPVYSDTPFFVEKYNNCSVNNKTVTNLQPFTRYLIELSQVSKSGQTSKNTSIINTPEAQPGPPINIEQRAFNESCLEIQWDEPDPPNGEIRNYSTSLSILDSYMRLSRQSLERYMQRQPGQFICKLMLSTRYSFSIQATNDAGSGPIAEITFWTPIAEPLPPPVPFARLSDKDETPDDDTTPLTILAQPVRYSTGSISSYYMKLATAQQLKDYENIYGVSTNGSALFVTPGSKADSALAALPGRLIVQVSPDRFELHSSGSQIYHTEIQVPLGQWYVIVWAYSVELQNDTRLAASVSEIIYVPGVTKNPPTFSIETTAEPPTYSSTKETVIQDDDDDDRITWVFGLVIALIILLVIIAIIVIILCCCLKRFDAPQEPKTIVKWSSTEHVQTDDQPPLELEDWFNPTTQIDDSRYVVRGQRVLTPTKYSSTLHTIR